MRPRHQKKCRVFLKGESIWFSFFYGLNFNIMIKILGYGFIAIVSLLAAGFIGKTTIATENVLFHVERPFTAIAFLAVIILGMLEL